MDSLSFPKGHLLSSTPVQVPEDSGYFGSGQRRFKSNVNVLDSSIKESSFKSGSDNFSFHPDFCNISPQLQYDDNSENLSIQNNDSLSFIEVDDLSEFELARSNSSNQDKLYELTPSTSRTTQLFPYNCYNYLGDTDAKKHFYDSLSEDKDIEYRLFESETNDLRLSNELEQPKNYQNESFFLKRNTACAESLATFKKSKVDFIHELNIRNCSSVISCMLAYLSAKDLCKASCVSKEWIKVILNDSKANTRRKQIIGERHLFLNGPSKENRLGMRCGPAREHKRAFSNLTNYNAAEDLPVAAKVSNTRFDSFIKEAKNGEKLLKCPKCCHASKYLDRNSCQCTRCSYKFCCNCLAPILQNHTCFKPQLPNIVIGSRKSKKNLRRL